MRLEQKIERLKKQVISPERARAMAEDIYTKKGFSSLRKEERDLKKTEEYLAQKKADYERFRAGFMEMSPEASPEEYEKTRRILEEGGKLYTQIKIDEINNLGAVRIRLRSLLAAIAERKGGE
jgi:hypothetical protein